MTVVYITKYALSDGITKADCELCDNGMAIDRSRGLHTYYHGDGRDWCRTPEAAIQRANEMRHRKLASLEKAKDKLIRINFTVPA